jgi:hypothetical protein
MMDYQPSGREVDVEEAGEGSSGGRGLNDGSAASLSGIRARNNRADYSDDEDDGDDDNDDDDDSEQVMTPRGVYVQRCMCVSYPCQLVLGAQSSFCLHYRLSIAWDILNPFSVQENFVLFKFAGERACVNGWFRR